MYGIKMRQGSAGLPQAALKIRYLTLIEHLNQKPHELLCLMKKLMLAALTFVFINVHLHAQSQDKLYSQIRQADSLFFSALNNCDLEKYQSFLADDFESYHDKAGLTESRTKEMADIKIFCGEQRQRQHLRRELIKGTLKVYPVNNFGAIETGEHVFYLQINDGTEKLVAQARYTLVWKMENEMWRISRNLSYDHQPLGKVKLSTEILDRYNGNYQASDRIINIKREHNILRITDINDGKVGWSAEILPETENKFYLNYENAQVEFVRQGKKVVKLVIYENGKKLEEARRVE